MTSPERVLATFRRERTGQVPRWCGASHDSILPETPVENVLAMFDAAEAFQIP